MEYMWYFVNTYLLTQLVMIYMFTNPFFFFFFEALY